MLIANFQCEYCHYPEFLSTSPLTIDHIKPQSLGGSDDVDNLASACRRCNELFTLPVLTRAKKMFYDGDKQ